MADTPARDLRITVIKPARGRPRVAEPQTTISARVPTCHYDQIVRMANAQEKSLSAMVRDLLVLQVPRLR